MSKMAYLNTKSVQKQSKQEKELEAAGFDMAEYDMIF